MGRTPCCEKVGIKRGRWTAEEDETLRKYIEANGEGSWRSLPKNAGLLRCGKSCRLRWINYLRSDLKRGNISAAEEDIIINLHASMGNRWSLIAGYLPGRTDNEIKNYWNSHLSRKIHSFRRLNPNFVPPPLPTDSTAETKKRTAKKSKNNNSKNSPSKKQILPSKQVDTAVEIIPTTPNLEKEALSSCTMEWQEKNDVSGTLDASPPEESMVPQTIENRSLMLCLDDMMADLNDIWSMDEDRGFENGTIVEGCLGTGIGENEVNVNPDLGLMNNCWDWDWGQEENTSSFWDNEKGERGFEMEDEKQNAMLAWLLS